ncbi:DUF4352 domain-containing protein [Streptomyces sp. NPDC102340]|uniref:DUF4352 domain-containing protein n=1 Tax=unclassified Streptomyces TaxID=2593676 RepID=UPI00382ACD92
MRFTRSGEAAVPWGYSMSTYIRRAVFLAVPAVLVAVLTGCSSEDAAKGEAKPTKASASFAEMDAATPAEEPPAAQAPLLVAGTNGPFDVHDDSGNAVKTQMNVKVESAKYVTATELGTSKKPEHGQYVALKLTLKNVGKAPGRFAAYGAMMWQDAKTAPQDCTTLEIVDGPDLDTEYAPGQSATGTIILDIPRKGGTVTYYDAPGAGAFAVLLPSS